MTDSDRLLVIRTGASNRIARASARKPLEVARELIDVAKAVEAADSDRALGVVLVAGYERLRSLLASAALFGRPGDTATLRALASAVGALERECRQAARRRRRAP